MTHHHHHAGEEATAGFLAAMSSMMLLLVFSVVVAVLLILGAAIWQPWDNSVANGEPAGGEGSAEGDGSSSSLHIDPPVLMVAAIEFDTDLDERALVGHRSHRMAALA